MKQILKLIYKNLRDIYFLYQFPREGGYSYFRGVFKTFEQAIQSAPRSKNIGYNYAELAKEYSNSKEQLEKIREYDYPMLFWLQSILNNSTKKVSILDFGGNVGTHFYAYQKYIKYPENLQWVICDVPEIVKSGKELAQSKQSSQISFTEKIENIKENDIFMASGSIQYVENLSLLLNRFNQKPSHLLLNRLPLCEKDGFVTLQNGGKVFYPQYVFNRLDFIESLKEMGYNLIDIWENHLDTCIIPFHPSQSVDFYYGMYLKLRHKT